MRLGFLQCSDNVWLFDKHQIYDCFQLKFACYSRPKYTCTWTNCVRIQTQMFLHANVCVFVCFDASVLNNKHGNGWVYVRAQQRSMSMYAICVCVFFCEFRRFSEYAQCMPIKINTECVLQMFMLSPLFVAMRVMYTIHRYDVFSYIRLTCSLAQTGIFMLKFHNLAISSKFFLFFFITINIWLISLSLKLPFAQNKLLYGSNIYHSD